MKAALAFGIVGFCTLAIHADPRPMSPIAELLARAKSSDGRAQMELAHRYGDGKGVTRDYGEALRRAHAAADRGDPEAMDFVGWMYSRGLGVKRSPENAAGFQGGRREVSERGLESRQ